MNGQSEFQSRHRRSIRLRDYDYRGVNGYFVTVCTHNRECLFGEVVDREIRLNEYGEIVRDEWLKTASVRLNVTLDAFVIMPNHLHGIVIFAENVGATRWVARRGEGSITMSKPWPLVPLGEVAVLIERPEIPVPGTTYRQIGVKLWGEGAYERESIDGGQTKYKTLSRVETDDIIVNKIWARSGSVAVVSQSLAGCYGSNEFPTFAPVRENLGPRWFHWFTKTKRFWEQCDEKSRGTSGKNRIRPEGFLEIKIPLPSLPEQRQIVARIEELAAKIEEARGLRRQAANEMEAISSVMATAVFDNPEWTRHTIEELVGRVNLKNGKSLKTTDQPSNVRCLTLSALRHGRINCSDTKPIPMTTAEAEPYLVHPGDVFVVRGNGSKELVGRAGMIEGNCDGVIFPDLFIRVPLNSNRVLSSFLVAVWNSRRIRDIIEENAKTTSGIWKINQGHIALISIPVPPLSEQHRIVVYLDDLQAKANALKRLQAETAAELDALLPSVLDKAFKGEL